MGRSLSEIWTMLLGCSTICSTILTSRPCLSLTSNTGDCLGDRQTPALEALAAACG